ncbi:MAG: DUF4954 family protein [Spirochaetaceae bacterium]|jgi:NDP-sugar pyrophosphorylase family protein|nr:DUF4954 family protein [Spirochaetaceae bacterium]
MSVSFTPQECVGYGFIRGAYVPPGKDEFYLRDSQLEALYADGTATDIQHEKRSAAYRHITAAEQLELEAGGSRSPHWDDFWVCDPFNPRLIRNCFFAGKIRIGVLKEGLVRHHDYALPSGIESSRIISCDIGDHPAIYDCRYLSHYIIGDRVILSSIGEMSTTNHAKFGEGIIKEGEDETVRISIDLLNETGGRSILPFTELIPADAYLWATCRDDRALMDALFRITQNGADTRRGLYGVVGHGAVIKHCRTIKDVHVGDAAYIKGANKLKNLTLRSTSHDPIQIGEGVELVNGIIGPGCHVFYGCKAVRFVLGSNCSLKYGARLIHSVLGDNSTVSCCEVLNNLVFPAHEQHHNNSFLIATMLMGQTNLAAGATVGSNHNSRGNDGEIIAGRGFWPGLSSALKHNSRFASFLLITRGNYPGELDIPLPFSLLTNSADGSCRELMPAYWWMHNMYALERNAWKFKTRDKRVIKTQHIEMDYLAPDTVAEIIQALGLIECWAGRTVNDSKDDAELRHAGRQVLSSPSGENIILEVGECKLERSRQYVRILKPAAAYRAYHDMLLHYAVSTLKNWDETCNPANIKGFDTSSCSLQWENFGGQLVPQAKATALRAAIREGKIVSWRALHDEYDRLWAEYPADKAANALQVLRFLYDAEGNPASSMVLHEENFQHAWAESERIRRYIKEQVYLTKRKDYTDPFRNITYRSAAERDAVLGSLDDNPFICRHAKDA